MKVKNDPKPSIPLKQWPPTKTNRSSKERCNQRSSQETSSEDEKGPWMEELLAVLSTNLAFMEDQKNLNVERKP